MKRIPIRQIAPSDEDPGNSGLFSVRKLEDLTGEKDLLHGLHRHNFFFILAIKKGSGKHEIDFLDFTVKNDSIFILRPGQVHQLDLRKNSSGLLIEFNPGFYNPSRKHTNRNCYHLDPNNFQKLHTTLRYLSDEYKGKQEGYLAIIKSILEIFFTTLSRQSYEGAKTGTNVSPYVQQRLEEFLELLETSIAAHKQVSWYTEKMSLSAYQLNSITKATIGKNASDMITDQTILEAKRYLLATGSQVKEIADLLGYEDISYFIRFFKKHTGYSPDAFRNNSK